VSKVVPRPVKSFAEDVDPRRRSERVLLVLPVEVAWTTSTGVRAQQRAESEVVGAHGALLRMKTAIRAGTKVLLTRILPEPKAAASKSQSASASSRGEAVEPQEPATARARVVWSSDPEPPDGLARVGVGLDVPSYTFWGISFPPSTGNWSQK
jgi:hypothetical protein